MPRTSSIRVDATALLFSVVVSMIASLGVGAIAAARVTDLHRRLRESEHQRGRLEGVQLAARTIEHELRNALTRTAGCSQILVSRAALPPDLHQVALNALSGVRDASAILNRLTEITSVAEKRWGPAIESTIDLDDAD